MAWRFEHDGMTHTASTRDQLINEVRQQHPDIPEEDIRDAAEEIPDDELGGSEDVGEGAAEEGFGPA